MAPAVAVNEIGAPSVIKAIVCAAGLGGAVNVREVAESDSVDGGAVIFSVTPITAGDPTPNTVSVTDAMYWPSGRLVGFTITLTDPGNVPLFGLAVSQYAVAGAIAVMNDGLPALTFTLTDCAFGNADPD